MWRKFASVQLGYQEFVQVLLGVLCETSLLLGLLIEKRKLIHAKGRGRGRSSKLRRDLQGNKITAQSPLERRKHERNVKRHYFF